MVWCPGSKALRSRRIMLVWESNNQTIIKTHHSLRPGSLAMHCPARSTSYFVDIPARDRLPSSHGMSPADIVSLQFGMVLRRRSRFGHAGRQCQWLGDGPGAGSRLLPGGVAQSSKRSPRSATLRRSL